MDLIEIDRRRDGQVATITLDDPDRRNAMSASMGEQLEAALRDLADDEALRVIVVTGAPPAFSGGGDLDMLEDHARRAREEDFDATQTMLSFYRRFLALVRSPVPVIAAVNGHAVGAGACVALASDLMLIARDARFGLTFAQLGLHPGMGGSWLLPRRVGTQRAAELLYTGRLVTGTEAADHGMALRALPTGEVLPEAQARADDIAGSSPTVVRQLKRSLAAAESNSLPRHLELEAANQAVNYASDELQEGLAAIRDRRDPEF